MLGFLLLLSACSRDLPIVEAPAFRGALIDSAEVLIMESWPLQAMASIRGNFRNGCEQISDVSVEQVGPKFEIALTVTEGGKARFCTQALVPFEESIPLDILGLKAGEYFVEVNGNEMSSFVLEADNKSL